MKGPECVVSGAHRHEIVSEYVASRDESPITDSGVALPGPSRPRSGRRVMRTGRCAWTVAPVGRVATGRPPRLPAATGTAYTGAKSNWGA